MARKAPFQGANRSSILRTATTSIRVQMLEDVLNLNRDMPYKNPDAQKRAQHESYLRNIDKYRERTKTGREIRRGIIREGKNKPCADCKQSYPYYVMDYDHTDENKSFGVSNKKDSVSIQTLKEEIAKCEVVCANCHRIRTWKRKELKNNAPVV